MEYTYNCAAEPSENLVAALEGSCFDLLANDHLIVFGYGEKQDLRLDIYKDEDYDKARGEYNLVVVHTSQQMPDGMMQAVDNTEDIYVGNGELAAELERIYRYEGFGLL